MKRAALVTVLVMTCAACAPVTYTRPNTSDSQRDLEACRLEGQARTTEALPRFSDYRVQVTAFEAGPYDLESSMRFAAEDGAKGAYERYFDRRVSDYLPLCMERKGYSASS